MLAEKKTAQESPCLTPSKMGQDHRMAQGTQGGAPGAHMVLSLALRHSYLHLPFPQPKATQVFDKRLCKSNTFTQILQKQPQVRVTFTINQKHFLATEQELKLSKVSLAAAAKVASTKDGS